MLLRNDLDELLACDSRPAVSIYLPTHAAGREVRQDAIRLRNLLSAAAPRLAAERRGPEVAGFLEPARRLVDDEEFWRHQEQGLAVFVAPGFCRVHKLPVEVAEDLTIGNAFRIRPLLPLVEWTGSFWLLALTAGRSRVYRGSRWSLAEVHGLNLPAGISELRNETVYQETHNAAPVGRPARGPAGLGKAQAFGDAPDELHKEELIELLRRIAAAIEPAIKREPAPIVLAANPEIQGHFRDVARWKALLPEGILENPGASAPEELHRKAWRLFAPRAETMRGEALARLHSLLGNHDGRATTDAEEIVAAARYSRVDQLFLANDAALWGSIEGEGRVVTHRDRAEGDDDLLNLAAVMTLRYGGNVVVADPGQLPPDGPAAAILRY